jgi:NYN domain
MYATDNLPPTTLILISGDHDFSYAISTLRLRQYFVVVIAPPSPTPHISLKAQASLFLDWNHDIIGKSPVSPHNGTTDAVEKPLTPPRKTMPGLEWRKYQPNTGNPPIQGSSTVPIAAPPTVENGWMKEASFCFGKKMDPSFSLKRASRRDDIPPKIPTYVNGQQQQVSAIISDPTHISSTRSVPGDNHAERAIASIPLLHPKAKEAIRDVAQENVISRLSCAQASKPANRLNLESLSSRPTADTPPATNDSSIINPHSTLTPPFYEFGTLSRPFDNSATLPPPGPTDHVPSSSHKNAVHIPASSHTPSTYSGILSSPSPHTRHSIPPEFIPLVEFLERETQKGNTKPLCSNVALSMFKEAKMVYKRAGVANFSGYSALAEKAGIVQMGGTEGEAWIALSDVTRNIRICERNPADRHGFGAPVSSSTSTVQYPIAVPISWQPDISTPTNRSAHAQPATVTSTLDSYQHATSPSVSTLPRISSMPTNSILPVSSAIPQAKSVPERFIPLVRVLESERLAGNPLALRSKVAEVVGQDHSAFRLAGVTKFRQYAELAEKAGIIRLGGQNGKEWISLNSDYWLGETSGRITSPTTPVTKPVLPGHFITLVQVLEKERLAGNTRPLRSKVAVAVIDQDHSAFRLAGVTRFRQYADLAEKAGIIQLGGKDGNAWISLNSDCDNI